MTAYGTLEFAETYDVEEVFEDLCGEDGNDLYGEELYGFPEYMDIDTLRKEMEEETALLQKEWEYALKANEELRQDPIEFLAEVIDVPATEITVSEVLEATGANDSKVMVEAIITHQGKTRQVKCWKWSYPGTMWEPPDQDFDYEIVWGEDFDF